MSLLKDHPSRSASATTVRCPDCGHLETVRRHSLLADAMAHLHAPRTCPVSTDDYHLAGWELCGCTSPLHAVG